MAKLIHHTIVVASFSDCCEFWFHGTVSCALTLLVAAEPPAASWNRSARWSRANWKEHCLGWRLAPF